MSQSIRRPRLPYALAPALCRTIRSAVMAAAAALLAVCSSSTDPDGGGTTPTLRPNERVTRDLTAGDSVVFVATRDTPPDRFALRLEVLAGEATLTLYDSTGRRYIGQLSGSAAADPVGGQTIGPIWGGSLPGAHLVARASTGAAARIRVQLYVPSDAPERRSAAIAVGDTISGEALDGPGDVDVFTVRGAKGDELAAYLQLDGSAAADGRVPISVVDPGGVTVLGTLAIGRTGDLEEVAAFGLLPQDGDYHVRIGDGRSGTYVGGYRFQLRRRDSRPEHVAAALPVGDSVVAERLDYVGDADEFTLTGRPGDEYNILLRAVDGQPETALRLEIDGTGAASQFDMPAVVATSAHTSLFSRGIGRFTLPSSGRVIARVAAVSPGPAGRVAYRLFAYRISRAPEATAATMAIGQTVAEALDLPGDVDEYALSVPAPTLVNLALTLDARGALGGVAGVGGGASAQLLRRDGTRVTATQSPTAPGGTALTGNFTLPTGEYVLRVQGLTPQEDSYAGGYRVILSAISEAPEGGVATHLAYGDAVDEALDPLGDVDTYTFDGRVYDDVAVHLAWRGAPPESPAGPALGTIFRPVPPDNATSPIPIWPEIGGAEQPRITLPVTGRYTIRVVAVNGADPTARGPYRLTLQRLSTAVEHAAQTLAIGDAVTTEDFDGPADVDEFTVRGTPGDVFSVRVRGEGEPEPKRGIRVELLDPLTRVRLRSAIIVSEYTGSTGGVRVPAGGSVVVRVTEMFYYPGEYERHGPYRFDVLPGDVPSP